ncbi:MAG: hypothetical protein KTR13_08860 [Saprospiraceae bacterium]|nr:hypothetical protein [Saprospiraceae bacterium]
MRYLLSLVLICFIVPVFAQQTSPYSRFGIGGLYPQEYAPQRAMGNISAGYKDTIAVNYQNPANFSNKIFSSIDIGLDASYKNFQDQVNTDNATNGSIAYLAYSFPVNKSQSWGIGFGAQPVSFKSYDIISPIINDRFYQEFEGDGNSYRLFLSNGVRFGDFSVGLDAGIFFGHLEDNSYNTFISSVTDISSAQTFDQKLRGVNFKPGVQYTKKVGTDLSLTFGGTYQIEADINNEIETRTFTFRPTFNDVQVIASRNEVQETSKEVINTEITLPSQFAVGAYLDKKEKWSLGLDFKSGQWANFSGVNDVASVNYENTFAFNLGGSFIPDYTRPQRAYEAFEYRYGGYYEQTYLEVSGERIADYGITLGVGLPMRRPQPDSRYREVPSSFNLGVAFGQTGTLNNNLVQESYIKGSVGMNFNDIWFRKRKYD